MAIRTYYNEIGVPPTASQSEIYDAYLRLTSDANPDNYDQVTQTGQWAAAHESTRLLHQAYSVLGDAEQRAEYDVALRAGDATNIHGDSAEAEHEPEPAVPHIQDTSNRPAEPAYMGCTSVQFKDLPSNDQEMLRSYLNDRSSRGVTRISTNSLLLPMLFGITSLGWIIIVICLANDKRWDDTLVPTYLAGTMFAAVALWFSCITIENWRKAPLRPCALFTPLYFVFTTLEWVRYWPMGALESFKATHHYHNGIYTHTSLVVKFAGKTKTLKLRSKKAYESLVEIMARRHGELIAAADAGDEAFLSSRNIFAGYEAGIKRSAAARDPKIPNDIRPFIRVVVVGCVLGGLWFGCAYKLNDYYDDGIAWNEARAMSTASSYRKYLEYRPKGRFRSEANSQISRLYADAGKHYQDIRSGLYDKSASDAVLEVLGYAKATGRYHVRIAFERHNLIPKGVEKQYADGLHVSKVIPLGDAFSDQRMTAREDNIVSSISSAFATVMAKDILSFDRSGYDNADIIFAVKYAVVPGQSMYYREKDASLPSSSRPYYPGIGFAWGFEIRVPTNKSAPYRFELESSPAQSISYQTSSEGLEASAETGSVYDAMAQSAFDNFRKAIVRHFGLGRDGKRAGQSGKNDRLNKQYQELSALVEAGTKELTAKGLFLDSLQKNLADEDKVISAELKRMGKHVADPSNSRVRKYMEDRNNYNNLVSQFNTEDKKVGKQAARLKELERALGADSGN